MGGGPEYGMGYGPGPGMGRGMGPWAWAGRGMGPHGHGNPSAMADARLAYLKSELKITSGQETAWKAFADQAKQQAEAMQALQDHRAGQHRRRPRPSGSSCATRS